MVIRGSDSLRSAGAESNPFSNRPSGKELAYWYSNTVLGERCTSADPKGRNAFTRPINCIVCNSLPNLSSRTLPKVKLSDVVSASACNAALCKFTSGDESRRIVRATCGSDPLASLCEYEVRRTAVGSPLPQPTLPCSATVPEENSECSTENPVLMS